jgi:glycerol-3-phosphate acyltransferase PlsY
MGSAHPGEGRDEEGAVLDGSRQQVWWREPPVVVGAAWLAGSVPFAHVFARALRRVDLRTVGSGTVSGTSLYRVAGFGPLAVAGIADIAKGSVGPALAGPDRPALAAVAGAAGVAGHNWSPWLRGAGGRGISPAMGALLVRDWPGSVTLLGGMAAGRILRSTGLGSAVADVALVPVLRRWRGREGALVGGAILAPMIAKRLLGNRPGAPATPSTYLYRLLFDRDTRRPVDD